MITSIFVASLSIVACGNKSEKKNKEEKTEVISVEISTNDEESTTSFTNEENKEETTSKSYVATNATTSTKENLTKTPVTEAITKPPTATQPTTTSKPIETEAPTTHTHNWKAVKATRTIEGYLEEVPVTREYIILEEYHDCEECGYIDLDEAVDLWNEDADFYNKADKASHILSMSNALVEPYLRKCIKKAGTADLSTHSIADCAGKWLYDENDNLVEDENGSPIWTYTTIEHVEYRDEITRVWREPRTEEYIDHYECSCGARK